MNRGSSLFRPNQRKGGVRGGRKLKALSPDGFCLLGVESSLHAEDGHLRRIVSLKRICLRSVGHTRTRKLPGGNREPRPGQPGPCPGHTNKRLPCSRGPPSRPWWPLRASRRRRFAGGPACGCTGAGDGRPPLRPDQRPGRRWSLRPLEAAGPVVAGQARLCDWPPIKTLHPSACVSFLFGKRKDAAGYLSNS